MIFFLSDTSLITVGTSRAILAIIDRFALILGIVCTLGALLGLVLTRWTIVSLRALFQVRSGHTEHTIVASNTFDTVVG